MFDFDCLCLIPPNSINLCFNLLAFVKLCLTPFNSRSYAQILCLFIAESFSTLKMGMFAKINTIRFDLDMKFLSSPFFSSKFSSFSSCEQNRHKSAGFQDFFNFLTSESSFNDSPVSQSHVNLWKFKIAITKDGLAWDDQR